MDEKVPTKMLKWFKSFLGDRKGCVRFRSEKSKWKRLREELPQGAVSSSLLLLLYVNEWNSFVEEGVEYSGFVDDICIWAKDTNIEEANRKVQRASEKIVEWAKKNKIELNPTKSEACRFTNSKADQQKELKINIEGKEIPVGKEVTFLGVVFETNMSFNKQVEKVTKKVKKRTRIINAVAGKDWGWEWKSLRTLYIVMVESCIWYAAAGWMPWITKTGMRKIETAQREALRKVTGLVKSTPIDYIYLEAEVEPVSTIAVKKAIMAYEKAMRMNKENPLRLMCERESRKRLKTNKGLREQARAMSKKVLGEQAREEFNHKRLNPAKNDKTKYMSINFSKGGTKEEREKKKAIKEVLKQEEEDYVHMYTDGSVVGGQDKGGGACVTRIEGNEIIRRKAAGNNCNSFKAETVAMIEAVKLIKDKSLKKVKIWTDSKVLTEALSNFKVNRDSNLTELKKSLSEEAEKADIAICWIPGHVGIKGNEKADKEANIAMEMDQKDTKNSINAVKARLKKEDKVLATMG